MKKIIKRFFAYTIDMMVVLLITQSLSGLPAINKQLPQYTKYYKEYKELTTNYTNFKIALNKEYQNKELSQSNYEKIIKKNPIYSDQLTSYYDDQKLTEKEFKKLNKTIDKDYSTQYKKLYYQIEKNSTIYFAIYFLTTILYFVGFNMATNGQTLGKKLFHLKIVDSKDSSKRIPFWKYLVRSLFLYQILQYIVRFIGVYSLSNSQYFNVTSFTYNIQYYLEFLIIITMMIRLDGRGIHDLVAQTRVALFDRQGNEIEQQQTSWITKKLNKPTPDATDK